MVDFVADRMGSWQITLLALLLLPVFVLSARRMGTQMTERFSAPGVTLVKLFGRPARESAEFRHPGPAGT